MPIVVRGIGSLSALGVDAGDLNAAYSGVQHFMRHGEFRGEPHWVAPLHPHAESLLQAFISENPNHLELDRTVQLAIVAARRAFAEAGWKNSSDVGVLLGSSRGSTGLLENAINEFQKGSQPRVPILTSPLTTLGAISSMVARDLCVSGFAASHSMTCSTALHAVIHAVAWIRAGMGARFIVGGSEAPLTAFSIAQMKALRLYTSSERQTYPCRPLECAQQNTLVLGEGACVLAIEEIDKKQISEDQIVIESVGWGLESAPTITGISEGGEAFARSMSRACGDVAGPIDLIVAHAPGTIKGDRSELEAINTMFGADAPPVVSNKWLLGHTFGASGAFSLECAIWMLTEGMVIGLPYIGELPQRRSLNRILVNSGGFGGNAVSVVLSKGSRGGI